MRFRPTQLKSLFGKFKEGDPEALEAILSSEKDRLFDYLMRMTGQVSRSVETLSESINGIFPVADQEENFQDFLVLLYRTARSFAIEDWNADTSRLENVAYSSSDTGLSEKMTLQILELERVLRSLPAKQREVILLRLRYGFSLDEIAGISSYPLSDVEEFLAQGLSVTEAALGSDKIPDYMVKLLSFPIPDDQNDGTQNLSLIVRDLKKSSKSTPGGVFRLLVGVMVLGSILYAAWRHEKVFEYIRFFFEP